MKLLVKHVSVTGVWRTACSYNIFQMILVSIQISSLYISSVSGATQTFHNIRGNRINHQRRKPLDLDQIAPEITTLLDTDVSEWREWITNTGKYEGWRLQTHPLLQRKVFGVCQVLRSENKNWLFSPIVRLKDAQSVVIEVTYTMRRCVEHPDPEALKFCHESLSLMVFHSDSILSEQLFLNESQTDFQSIANLTLNDVTASSSVENSNHSTLPTPHTTISEERVARYVNRMKVHASKLAVAILDKGTCSTLRRVHLSYIACAKFQRYFVEFPRTVTGEGSQSTNVKGQCISGAAPLVGSTMPELLCLSNGRWSLKTKRATKVLYSFLTTHQFPLNLEDICACNPGYGVSVHTESREFVCQACGENEYKTKLGPYPCRACPQNSFKKPTVNMQLLEFLAPLTNKTDKETNASGVYHACQCRSGYYRHPELDNEDSPCTTLPSAPISLSANVSDPVRIELRWKTPLNTGGRASLWFVVKCLDLSNRCCTNQPTYVQPNPTHTNSIMLIGLTLGETYVVTVTATNDLTELLPDMALNLSASSISVTLPEPVSIFVSNIVIETGTSGFVNASSDADTFGNVVSTSETMSGTEPMVFISWRPPEDHRYGTEYAAAVHIKQNHFIMEYQVYVWISSLPNSRVADQKRLLHFLSDTKLPLAHLPRRTLLRVWVRPRTLYGWGQFTKVELEYPKRLSHSTQSRLMSDSSGSEPTGISTLVVSGTKRTQKIIWLTIICALAFCLLVGLLLLLKGHKLMQRQWRRPTSNEIPCQVKGEIAINESLRKETIIAELQQEDERSSLLNNSTQDAIQDRPIQNEHNTTPSPARMCAEETVPTENIASEKPITEQKPVEEPANSCDLLPESGKELDPKRIKIQFTIGEGEFGKVCAGAFDGNTLVAVKMLHPDVPEKTQQDFLKEADTMQQLSHPNIVKLIGVVTKNKPRMIVTEFMHHGSLDKYLQGVGNAVKCYALLHMLTDICKGMKYLSGLGFVHRDLAARNILIDESQTCKISDFGLARKIGEKLVDDAYTLTGGKVPIRWTSPEAVIYRRFTIASDVWSFGIVSWEVFSYGQRPYWDWTNQTVISMLERGYRLPCPEACPKDVYNLMLTCWSTETDKRPNFEALGVYLEQLLEDEEPLINDLPNGEVRLGSKFANKSSFVLPTAETFTNLLVTSNLEPQVHSCQTKKAVLNNQEFPPMYYKSNNDPESSKLLSPRRTNREHTTHMYGNGLYYNVAQHRNRTDRFEPTSKLCNGPKELYSNTYRTYVHRNGPRV